MGWTGPAATFLPTPGNYEIINDPQFENPLILDFNLQSGSPCIDRGTDSGYGFNSFAPDLGAKETEYSNFIGTRISGTLSGELNAQNSPYLVDDDIIVPSGSSLKISSGTILKINAFKTILVNGTLTIEGSDFDSVYIKQNSIYNKYWGGIVFSPGASNKSIISKANITNAGSNNVKGIIYCSNDSVTISNNYFSNNSSSIYCESNSYPGISGNNFYASGGCVIYCASGSKPVIENNEFFSSNVYCLSSQPVLKRNKFLGQTSQAGQQYWLLTLYDNSNAYLEGNLFRNNYGAILIESSSVCTSYNNLIYNCTNTYLFTDRASGHIYNNTIYPENFGIWSERNSTVYIVNSIVWKYGSYGFALKSFDSSKIYSSYNILSDQFEGENNLYKDPLFVNPLKTDFHLLSGSPGIDSGTLNIAGLNLPLTDFDSKDRFNNGRIDIGCYEHAIINSIPKISQELPSVYFLEQNYPNPFNPNTTINYSVAKSGLVTIKVYDILGREVTTLVNENKLTGNYSVQFNAAKITSGVYFYRMESGSFVQTKKLVVLK